MSRKKSFSQGGYGYKRTNHWVLILKVLGLSLLISTVWVGYSLVTQPQDIRQEAAGCSEDPVNVEFKYSKDERGWGERESFVIGDNIDVNCFAKNGVALLSSGKFTLTVDGVNTPIPAANLRSNQEVRGFKITKSGTYAWTCSNNAGCANTDQFVVTSTSTPPAGSCTNNQADLNKDNKVDILDYNLFLREFLSCKEST